MPSSASTRLRLNLQAPGEGNNVWGSLLNAQVFQLVDDAIAGRTAFALSGTKTLTSTNFVTNEARAAFLDVTSGTGGTVTLPGYEKLYLVRNATSGDVVFTTGGTTNATVKSGNIQAVACDGTNVYLVRERDLGADLLSTSSDPTLAVHLARKGYVDGLNSTEQAARLAGIAAALATAEAYTDATSFAAGSLPGGGSTGQYLRRIAGPSADWHDPFPQTVGGAYDGKVLWSIGGVTTWALALPAQTVPALLYTSGSAPSWAAPISGKAGQFLTNDGTALSWANLLNTALAKSANYTLATTDRYKVVEMTSAATLSLPAAATAGDGFSFYVRNAGTGTWTIDPDSAETIEGLATIQVYPKEAFAVICDGSAWRCFGRAKRVLVGTTVISVSVATVDIEPPFTDAELARHIFELTDLTGTGTVNLRLKKSGAYQSANYGGGISFDNGGAYGTGSWSSTVQLSQAGSPLDARLEIASVANGGVPTIMGQSFDKSDLTRWAIGFSGGLNVTATAVQGARFYTSGGNLTAGTITHWAERS